jgi:hypothetical protein
MAPLVVLSLVGVACSDPASEDQDTAAAQEDGSQDGSTMDDGGTGAQAEAVALDEGAPALAQGLTDLLDGHVYLASIAVVQGLNNGLDSPEFKAAAATLDKNSIDLAAAIGSVYGPEAEKAFLKQWREHITFFVQYTEGLATDDSALAKDAKKKLSNYKKDFAAFLESATEGGLPADAGADALQMHVDSLIDAIDAAAAGDAAVFDKVYAAASQHMPMTATALAGAIAQQFPEDFPGSVDSPASQLQQGLTDLLDSHVYLAAIAVSTGLGSGLDSPEFAAAAKTLDSNSVDLSKAIGSVYGKDAEKAFLKQWREHITFFVQYTEGKATGNKAMAKEALTALSNYKKDFAAFLESATEGGLPADAGADALQMHVDSLIEAIDAAIAGDADVFDKIYAAATGHMPMTAGALAGAITQQFPDEFPIE